MATVPNEVAERVRSYIAHQVAKGPENIRDTVQKGHEQLVAALDGLSEEQANFKPGGDVWSVLEVLNHAKSGKRGTARLCAALARGEGREGSAQLGRATEGLSSLAEARAELDEGHQEMLEFLAALSPETNTEATFDHPFFGALNCLEWAAFQRVHDGDHTQQIEQIKAASGFPAA